MSERKILGIIEELEEKLKKSPNTLNMNFNNINNDINYSMNNNFQNFNNINRPLVEFKNPNYNFNSINANDNIDDNYIIGLIKKELPGLIYQYQQDLSNRMNYIESKIDSINRKLNENLELKPNNINNDNKNLEEQGNKLSELEYKISEIESFFKLWKGIIKDSDDNIYNSRIQMKNEQELKLMQLDNKISNELNKFYNIINKDIIEFKKSVEQVKNYGIELNKLEVEMKTIKVDFAYLGQDVNDIKSFFKNDFKNELGNIKRNNDNLINDIYLLKEDFENTKKKLGINKKIKSGNNQVKESDIYCVEEIKSNNNNNAINNED